jgi:hypothetical protein
MASQECTWVVQLLRDLRQPTHYGVKLYCDNQSSIHLVENPVFNARTKHVEVHYHFIRKNVLPGDIEMEYINTQGQAAHIFTKGLHAPKFENFRRQLR